MSAESNNKEQKSNAVDVPIKEAQEAPQKVSKKSNVKIPKNVKEKANKIGIALKEKGVIGAVKEGAKRQVKVAAKKASRGRS